VCHHPHWKIMLARCSGCNRAFWRCHECDDHFCEDCLKVKGVADRAADLLGDGSRGRSPHQEGERQNYNGENFE
jgi:hypothetical protein